MDRLKREISAAFSWLGDERDRIKASKYTEPQKAVRAFQPEIGLAVDELAGPETLAEIDTFSGITQESVRSRSTANLRYS